MSGVATESGGAPPEINAEDAPSIERVAAAFPNLDEIELVGRGGMGFVFKARQPHLERYVALKLLPDKLAADPHFAERFNREGRVLAKLNHPNIVSVYDFGQTDQFYFLMMEFVDGVNLRQAMRAGRFSPAEALAVVPNICEALQYAHDQGVLHRDIKPENILLDTDGRAKIADFGIAKLVGEDAAANVTLTMTGSSLGTPHYMAPEQLEKPADVDHRADIYSLGVVLYELLTGELPIGRFEPPSAKTPVGKGVDEVVFRALDKNREKRQHSAKEFQTQVESAGTGDVPPKLGQKKLPKTGLCWPAVIGASLVGLSAMGVVITLLLVSMSRQGPGVSFTLLIFVGLPVMLAAVAGTIFGWVGLTQIKRSNGDLYGIPPALFAAVAYPFGLPALIIIGLPLFTAYPADNGPSWIARIIIFMLIAGLLSALVWSVVAIGRWARNRPSGQHWSTRGWAITAGGIFLVFVLITLSASGRTGRRAEFIPAPQIAEISAVDRLPEGVVELLAISRHPSDGVWWKPDGTAWTDEPFENPGNNASANKDQQALEMVFRLPPGANTNLRATFKIAGSQGSSGGGAPIQNGRLLTGGRFMAVTFPKDLVSTSISVGIVDRRNWETLLEQRANAPGEVNLNYRGTPAFVSFQEATEDGEGDTSIELTHNLKVDELRVVAINHDYEEIFATKANWSSKRMTAKFADTPMEKIHSFRFQTVPVRWAVFEDVWLTPREGESNNGALSQRGVRIDFQGVELVKRNGEERLEVIFKTEVNRAHLSWGTSGSFDEGPVDLLGSGSVTEQAEGPAIIIHKESLLMPSSLDRDVVIRALQSTREKWNGQSLVVLPGDKHTVMTIQLAPGRSVSLTVGSKLKAP